MTEIITLTAVVAVIVFYVWWIIAGFRKVEIESPIQHKAKIALRVTAILNFLVGIVVFYPALIMGTFASDSGTTQAIHIAYLIILTPFIFFLVPAIPRLLYELRLYRAAYVLALLVAASPLLVIGLFFLEFSH